MLLHRNKRKTRDFLTTNEPCEKKKFTEAIFSELNQGKTATVKWNPGLYELNRFDVPLPINKRRRELEENKANELDELADNLIRPLKKLHITPNKKNSQSPQACIKQSTIGKSPHTTSPTVPRGDPNMEKCKSSGNPKKVSLIEFLYNDNEDDFPTRPSEEKTVKKKTFKVSDGMRSWMGEMFCQDLSQKTDEPSTALTLYEKPFNTLQRRWIQLFEKYQTTPNWGEDKKLDPYPSSITVEEVDDKKFDPYPSSITVEEVDDEDDKKFDPYPSSITVEEVDDEIEQSIGNCTKEGCGERQGEEGGNGPGLEEVELDRVCHSSWKDTCLGGSWYKKDIPYSTLNGKFEVAQKGA